MVAIITRYVDAAYGYGESLGGPFKNVSTSVGAVCGPTCGGFVASQLFLLMLNLVLSIYPLIIYFSLSSTVHVEFWLGDTPKSANIAIPVLFLLVNVVIGYIKCVRLNARAVQVLLVSTLLIIGPLWVGIGIYVCVSAVNVAEDLDTACGTTSMTAVLQVETDRLNTFYAWCKSQYAMLHNIQQCPGFAQTFPAPVYVEYIAAMENDFGCAGFCYDAEPVFNMDGENTYYRQIHNMIGGSLTCADAIGEEMKAVASAVGTVTSFYGVSIIVFGLCIAGYEHI